MDPQPPVPGANLLLGAASTAWRILWRAGGPLRRGLSAAGGIGTALLATAVEPDQQAALEAHGRTVRDEAGRVVHGVLRFVITQVVAAALAELDLTNLVRENVDLNALVADVDLDAVVARVDLDAAVARVDFDAAVANVDLDAAVARVDIDAAVARVDIDAAIARVDLDAAVARVDLDAAVKRVDLDAAVSRVNLDAPVARVDLDAAVSRVDLSGIARTVIDDIDLPGIIRQSTGGLATDAVHEVRTQGMQADDAVAHIVGRLLGRRRPDAPIAP